MRLHNAMWRINRLESRSTHIHSFLRWFIIRSRVNLLPTSVACGVKLIELAILDFGSRIMYSDSTNKA